MPRCRDGTWCIDDLCYFTSQTLCGLWVEDDADDDEWDDYSDDDADETTTEKVWLADREYVTAVRPSEETP